MDTVITQCSRHDDRLNVTFFKGDIVLRIVGYDMLPHMVSADGKNYDRISWLAFRRRLTAPNGG